MTGGGNRSRPVFNQWPLLPSQVDSSREYSPEQKLIEAMLREAIDCGYGRAERTRDPVKEAYRARRWIASASLAPWSFDWCGTALGWTDAMIGKARETILQRLPILPSSKRPPRVGSRSMVNKSKRIVAVG